MGESIRRVLAGAVAILVAVPILVASGLSFGPPGAAVAADGSQFDPGFIMSDEVFYNSSRMSADQIQAFLNAKVPACRAGYTCLKDYREDMGARPNRVEGCTALPAAGGLSAAQIIWRVGVSCGINPQVLIVLLEKEQGLVTSTAPSETRYRIATGYGCPDTAACDAQYYGFSNQVWNAAKQFRTYRYYPGSWNYQAGRNNSIRWSPSAACGSSTVFIRNQATAGLYIYTPYRPNQAALANLYGTGDACSAYGNRNFWRTFTDWFGSTTVSSPLVQGPGSLQIWLIGNGVKYPINDPDVYYALSTLGPVVGVGQRYLDDLPTGHEATRFVSDPVGNLYYADSGSRYHFDSCERVVDWGYTCSALSWTTIDDGSMSSLTSRGNLTNAGTDPAGRYWKISDGARMQAADRESLIASGQTEALTSLSEPGIARLRIAAPIVRPDIVIKDRDSSKYWVTTSGTTKMLPEDLVASGSLSALPLRVLLPESVAFLAATSAASAVWTAGGSTYLLTAAGRVAAAPDAGLGVPPTTVSASTLDAVPRAGGTVGDPVYLRGAGDPTVYRVSSGVRRAIASPADLQRLGSPQVLVVAGSVATAAEDHGTWAFPGSIIKTAGSPRAYLVDGSERIIPVDSYATTAMLGLGTTATVVADRTVSTARIDAAPLTSVVRCDGSDLVGLDGVLRPASASVAAAFAARTTSLSAATCGATRRSAVPATPLLRDPTGAVWFMVSGARRYVPSVPVLQAIGGSASSITDVSASAISSFSTGTPLVSGDITRAPYLLRGSGDAKVYLLSAGVRSWVLSPADLALAQSGVSDPTVYVYPPAVVSALPEGSVYLRSGMVARAANDVTTYLLDGSTKWYVADGETLRALGASGVRVVPRADLAPFADGPNMLSPVISCDGVVRIGLGGVTYPETGAAAAAYGSPSLTPTPLSAAACATLPSSSQAPSTLLRAPDGRVYSMESGTRRWVTSPAALTRLAGANPRVLDVSAYTIGLFPSGADVS